MWNNIYILGHFIYTAVSILGCWIISSTCFIVIVSNSLRTHASTVFLVVSFRRVYLYNTKVRQNKPVLDTETLREIGVRLCHFARRLSGVWPMGRCSPAWFIRAGPGSSSLLSGTEQARSGGFKAEPVWWTLRWSKQQVHVVFCSALLKWEPLQGVTDLYHRHWFFFFLIRVPSL